MNTVPDSNSTSEQDYEPRFRHDFIVTLSGYGRDEEDAFTDALKSIENSSPYYDDYTSDPSDVAEEDEVQEERFPSEELDSFVFDENQTNQSFLTFQVDLISLDPALYTAIKIHGVRDEDALVGEEFDPDAETHIIIDDDNPQFFSAYLIDKDGMSEVIADASGDKLDQLRHFVTSSVVIYGWQMADYTLGKPIFTCRLCTKKVPSRFGPLHLCLDCYPKAPHIGTKVISLQGETSDTENGQDVFTGPNAEGIVEQILPNQENAFSIVFPNGVSVFLSIQEITDTSRYHLVKKYDVSIYAFVRVNAGVVEAINQVEAIKIAESNVDLHTLLKGSNYHFAEEVDSYIVDEVGDTHFLSSGFYKADLSKQERSE